MDDFECVLSSLEVGTVFLNYDLKIRKFTGSAARYFNLDKNDIGRSIEDFTYQFKFDSFYKTLEEVRNSGSKFNALVTDHFGNELEIKIGPHLSQPAPQGVIINVFSPIIQRDKSNQNFLPLPVGAGYWEWPDVSDDCMWWSPDCFELLNLDKDSPQTFSSWKSLVHPDDLFKLRDVGSEYCLFVKQGYLVMRMNKLGRYERFEFRGTILRNNDGIPVSMKGTVSSML